MSRKSLQHLECAVANTVEVLNDAWTVLVLRDAFLGVRRFLAHGRNLAQLEDDEKPNSVGIPRNLRSLDSGRKKPRISRKARTKLPWPTPYFVVQAVLCRIAWS